MATVSSRNDFCIHFLSSNQSSKHGTVRYMDVLVSVGAVKDFFSSSYFLRYLSQDDQMGERETDNRWKQCFYHRAIPHRKRKRWRRQTTHPKRQPKTQISIFCHSTVLVNQIKVGTSISIWLHPFKSGDQGQQERLATTLLHTRTRKSTCQYDAVLSNKTISGQMGY